MNTCSTCRHWAMFGKCATVRYIVYDNRHLMIPPGEEGHCRAMPPLADNRWPLTMGTDACGCWKPQNPEAQDAAPVAETLAEAGTEGATGGETREAIEPDSAGNSAPAEVAESTAETKAVEAFAPDRPPSLLQRITGRGQGRTKAQQ
jgi:hypothetical protein